MKISDREAFEKINVFGTGAENTAFARYFTGNSLSQSPDKTGRIDCRPCQCHI